jgi:Regulator of chromosome condensation (RCC1) repeat
MKLKSLLIFCLCLSASAYAQNTKTITFSLGDFLNGQGTTLHKNDVGVTNATAGNTTQLIPREIPNQWTPENALAIGSGHVLYLTKKGNVFAWGRNNLAQSGQGEFAGKNPVGEEIYRIPIEDIVKPTRVSISDVVALYAADNSSFALKKDGSVWAWGNGKYSGMGLTNDYGNPIPTQVIGLPPIAKVLPWGQGAYAFAADGTVWVWGEGDQARMLQGSELGTFQAGKPVRSRQGEPIDVRAPINDGTNTYVLARDGRVWNSRMKTPIAPLSFERLYGDNGYTGGTYFGLTKDAKIFMWKSGDLSVYLNKRPEHRIVQIEGIGNPIDIAHEYNFVVFLQKNGSLIVWGGAGTLGRENAVFVSGMTSAAQIPQSVNFSEKFATIKSNSSGILAMTASGNVYMHNAMNTDSVALKKGRGLGSFTELLKPEHLPE